MTHYEENNSPDNSRFENNSTEVHTSNTLEDKSVVEDNISKVETSDSPKEVKNEEKEIESNTIGHEKEIVEGEYNSQVEILNVINNVSGSSSETRISTESKISHVAENISHKEILCVEEKVESSCVLNDKLEVSENTNCVDNVPTPIADPCSKNKIVDKTNEINHCDSSSIDNETSNILPSTTPTSEEKKILEKKETSTEELDPGEIERIKRVRVVVDPLEDISNPCIKAFAKDDCAQTSQDDECTILFEEIKKPDVPRSRRERVSLTQIVCLSSSSEDEEESDKIRVGSEYQSVVEEFANQPRTGVYASSEDAPEDIAMWKPHHKVEEEQVDTFIKKANQEYNYREDQALGLLYHHKYNFTAAYAELSKYYNLLKKEWSKADKDKFEKLISKHKKNFDIIQVNVPNEMKETGVNPIVTATSKNCDLSNGTTSPTTKSIIELVSPICETLERTSTNDLSCTREYYIDTNSEHNANIEITNTEINSSTKNICSNNNESYPTDIDNVLQKEGDTEMKEILNNVNQFLNEEQSKETHTTEIEKHGSPSTGSNIEGDCTLSLCNKFKIDETINDSNCLDININNCSPTVIDNVNSLEEDYTLERPVEKTNPENKKETPIVETSNVLVSNSKLKNDVSEEHKNISTTINSLQKTTNVTEETLPIEETIPENSTCVLDKIASDGEKNVVQVDTNVSEPFTEELEVSSNAQSTSELEKNVSQEEKDDSKVKNDDLEVIGHGSKVKTCDEEIGFNFSAAT
ncbi:putative leucine-rich repeat-containing protein DDB_G0290503 [Diaphorina citri]|uniref:Leucine-rich repeat-containing protein DDB_G0290503 n=1 Tax=Diaphorina citri TaxID=121845 RepID=A0A3Q0IT81_DIACI|nr:putative leucine-rich repeat-containing protein DDB_G0290503 [Diaphorina citri]